MVRPPHPASCPPRPCVASSRSLSMEINGATELYGIMGNPVAHSLSPAMHNGAFAALGLNKVYLPFAVQDVALAMTGFLFFFKKGATPTIPPVPPPIPSPD